MDLSSVVLIAALTGALGALLGRALLLFEMRRMLTRMQRDLWQTVAEVKAHRVARGLEPSSMEVEVLEAVAGSIWRENGVR
jgi:cob(I)alamin adenosyltransferase